MGVAGSSNRSTVGVRGLSDSTTSQVSKDSLLALSLPLKAESLRDTKLSFLGVVGVTGNLRNDDVDIDILRDVVLKKGNDEREAYGELFDGCAERARSCATIDWYGKNVRSGESDNFRFASACGGRMTSLMSSESESKMAGLRLLVRPRGVPGGWGDSSLYRSFIPCPGRSLSI